MKLKILSLQCVGLAVFRKLTGGGYHTLNKIICHSHEQLYRRKKKHTIHAMETHLVGCYAIKVSHFLHIFVQDLLRVHFWYQVYQFLLTQHLPSRLRLTCNRIKETRLFFFPHPSIALLPFSSQKQSKTYGKTYPPSCWPLTANKRWLSYFCKRWLSSILAPLPQDGGFCNCQGHFWTR